MAGHHLWQTLKSTFQPHLMAPHAFLLLLCLALLNIHVLAANQYVIHFNVPLSATGQDPIQLQQWQDAATQAASEVSSAWSSSTGDTLVVDVLDDQGDVVVAASNAVRSAVNSSVSAILAAGLDSVSDAMELTARGFSLAVVSSTARSTSLPYHPGSTFVSLATAQSFDAVAILANLRAQGFSNLAVFQDMTDASLNTLAQALLGLPIRISAHIQYNSPTDALASLQQVVASSVSVMAIVSSNLTNIQPFLDLDASMGFSDGHYILLCGPDPSVLSSMRLGTQLFQTNDANAATLASFPVTMSSHGYASFTGQTLRQHAIHTYDAVKAIGRAIEVAVQAAPAVRALPANITAALLSSDYVGLTGNMSLDTLGFRAGGYALELNNQRSSTSALAPSSAPSTPSAPMYPVVTVWTFEQGIYTQLANTTFLGGSTEKPNADVTYYSIGEIANFAVANPAPLFSFAMSLVNADNVNWMPVNTKLYLLPYDDGDSTTGAVQAAISFLEYHVTGVLGAMSSSNTMASQNVLGPFHVPELSSASTNPALSKKSSYPYFLRNIQSDNLQGTAIVELVKYFGWSNIGLIYSTDAYSTGLATTVATSATAMGVNIMAQVSIDESTVDPVSAVKIVKNSGARILVLLTTNPTWSVIIQAMIGADYKPAAVLGPDALLATGLNFLVNTSGGAPESFFEGWLTTNPPSGHGPFWDDFLAAFAALGSQADVLFPGLTAFINSGLSYNPLLVDAVFIYADAIKRCIHDGFSPKDGAKLLQYLLATNLTLSTGVTQFDANGDRIGPFDVWNVVGGATPLVARYDVVNGYQSLQSVVWPSGDGTIPLDVIPRVPHWLEWSSAGGVVMTVLAAIGLLIVLLSFVVLIWQHHSPILISSTWEFLILMLFGAAVGYGSMFTWIGMPNKAACALRIWLPPLAFILILAPLLAKTWRLHRIFTLGSLKIVPIRLWKLVLFVTALVLLQIIICAFWIGFGTIEPITVNDPNNFTSSNVICEQNSANRIATWATFGYLGLCLLVGAYYAFRVRNLPKEFNESRFIGFTIYNCILIVVIFIILGYTLTNFPATVMILICIATWIISTAAVGFMLLPKFWTLYKDPSQRSSSINTSKPTHTDRGELESNNSSTGYKATNRYTKSISRTSKGPTSTTASRRKGRSSNKDTSTSKDSQISGD